MTFRDELIRKQNDLISQGIAQKESERIKLEKQTYELAVQIVERLKQNAIQEVTYQRIKKSGIFFRKKYVSVMYCESCYNDRIYGQKPIWLNNAQINNLIRELAKNEGFSEIIAYVKHDSGSNGDYPSPSSDDFIVSAKMYL